MLMKQGILAVTCVFALGATFAAPERARVFAPGAVPLAHQAVMGVPYLLFCMFNRVLPPYLSRKGIHMGIGALLLFSDMEDWRVHALVHAMAGTFVALTLAAALARASLAQRLPFMHDRTVDPGVLCYLLCVSACAALRVPYCDMAVLFFADPMGALVGRNVHTPKLYGSKSVGGTLAVWATAVAAWNDAHLGRCVAGATLTAAIELVGGDYDNVLIAALLLGRALAA